MILIKETDREAVREAQHLLSGGVAANMAGYDKFDQRLESLVVQTVTHWAPECADLSADEKQVIARAIHHHPQLASQIHYERTHTGFTREITVTEADIARLYEQHAEA